MVSEPYPSLDDLLTMMGETGRRLTDIEASEGAAGNISVALRWPVELRRKFPIVGEITLPLPVPELAGTTFLVSGSGRRLREIIDNPPAHLAAIVVNPGGQTGQFHTAHDRRFERVTSEFNSHLAVHYDQMLATGTNFHAVVHAQPLHITYLSHIARYADEQYLSTHLLRWQPETIMNLPEGIGFIPFQIPGSAALMTATVEKLRQHRMVIWAKHGVVARSDVSIQRATDRVEYAETAAKYEYLNLTAGEIGEGLSADNLRAICQTFNIQQSLF